MRKTKIICTIGPATEKTEVLRQLIQEGSDVFRLNMSHATHEWVREIVPRIRMLSKRAGRPIALLLDTQGPAIRTGDLKTNLVLKPGDILEFTVGGAKSRERYSVDVNYRGFAEDVTVGDIILVDNGLIKLLVLAKRKNSVRCKVLTRAILGSRRHINLPGVRVNLPCLTRKDLADISLGVEMGADFFGLSFVREKNDIEQLRKLLSRKGSKAQIVAKIEDQLAVRSIDKIIESADAIMVARGDLGIECPMEDLPIIQRRIVKNCLRLGKPVIVATQLLESMTANPLPTRAEITDVANAVFEQADAVMLSGETTIGRYPVECVEVLRRVAIRIERSGGAGYAEKALLENIRQKMVASAVALANSLQDSKLVVFTLQGRMAGYASNLRPERAPIFAFTSSEEVYRQLALYWGTFPACIDFTGGPDKTMAAAEKLLRKKKRVAPGDRMVIISDVRMGEALIDSIQVRVVK
ncbi:MAG TPA: pyruvate kinase [Candidatus Udaeobacter sp.]|jgi:pyruvate kinase